MNTLLSRVGLGVLMVTGLVGVRYAVGQMGTAEPTKPKSTFPSAPLKQAPIKFTKKKLTWSRQILWPDGTPAAGLKVPVEFRRWYDNSIAHITTATTDSQGIFHAQGFKPDRQGQFLFIVDSPKAAVTFADLDGGGEYQNAPKGPLRLAVPYSITGRVLDEAGKSVPGAALAIVVAQAVYSTPRLLNFVGNASVSPQLTANTNGQGEFAIRGFRIDGGRYWNAAHASFRIVALHKTTEGEWGGEAGFPLPPDAGAARPIKGDVSMRRLLPIQGKVIDTVTGQPVAGAILSTYAFSTLNNVTTNSTGTFKLNLARTNDAIINVIRDGYMPIHSNFKTNQPFQEVNGFPELQIPLRPLVRVSGKFVDSTSGQAPLNRLDLKSHTLEKSATGWIHTGLISNERSYYSDDKGQFSFLAPAGRIIIQASGPSETSNKPYNQRIQMDVPPQGAQDLKLSLDRSPGILVRMPDTWKSNVFGGDGIRVQVQPVGKEYMQSVTDAPVWFYPTERWGDGVMVQVTRRTPGKEQVLVPWTEYKADASQWPMSLGPISGTAQLRRGRGWNQK